MKNKLVVVFLFVFITSGIFSQEDVVNTTSTNPISVNVDRQSSASNAGLGASSAEAAQNIMLARSSPDYQVTAGDVYTLAYAAGAAPVSYIISVDNSYRIRVSNLGVISGAGKTFVQLKNEVETIVAKNYPLSGVQLVLTQPSIFKVYVKGEVAAVKEVSAWGLSRLSSLINGNFVDLANVTSRASIRDITITSTGGQTKTFDLFKAQRLGDMTQDPYLRPGDIVTFKKADRIVTVDGAVERPGTYQILEGEQLKELIEVYAGGFTVIADKSRVEMVRYVGSSSISGEKINLTEQNMIDNFILQDYDNITVSDYINLRPVIFLEGAIDDTKTVQTAGIAAQTVMTSSNEKATELTGSTRLVVPFNRGEDYATLIRRNRLWFTAVSDTQNAYIIRNSKHIPINLNPILYDAEYRSIVLIQENDTLIIPFRQYFISVAGAVINPGRYPYIPDRDWEYYIGLAGGFIAERNTRQTITITDINGNRMKKTDPIVPETVITASTNHALYYFNLYAPVITTILGLVSTIFSVQAYVNR
jgi:protein involved in polysaccharide export with SLBB domain